MTKNTGPSQIGSLRATWRKLAAKLNDPSTEDKWWFRYPLAALILWAAWYLVDRKPQLWWLSVLFTLGAAGLARELSLVILAIGLLVAVVSGLSALPVSLAVILGALVIAYGVYRAKDPSVDTRIPIIGKFIAQRRELKQTVALLQTPFYLTLSQALDAFWTNQPAHGGQINAQLMLDTRKQLVEEGMAIANSQDPVAENRTRLAAAIGECARLQVLGLHPVQ